MSMTGMQLTAIKLGLIFGLLLTGTIFGLWLANEIKPKNDLFTLGYFAINDIYHTCMYQQIDGFSFDGWCYDTYPQRDKVFEGCEIGCKLQTPYYADTDYCLSLCNEQLKELEARK